MNGRNLSRKLATSVVDALKSHGHILIVKGGATSLTRELDDILVARLEELVPRLAAGASLEEALDDVVGALTRALMDSDHVEDVFAADQVIRRDIAAAVRDGLRASEAGEGAGASEGEQEIHVPLESLGYVAATVSRRAERELVCQALERAAAEHARLLEYDEDTQAASFAVRLDDPDARLELEEAIADELTSLWEEGLVELPSIERRVDLGRSLSPSEQRTVTPRIEAAGQKTLSDASFAVHWDFPDAQTLRLTFTPLSEQDVREVDSYMVAFVRELGVLLPELSSKGAEAKEGEVKKPASAKKSATTKKSAATKKSATTKKSAATKKSATTKKNATTKKR